MTGGVSPFCQGNWVIPVSEHIFGGSVVGFFMYNLQAHLGGTCAQGVGDAVGGGSELMIANHEASQA